MLRSVAIAALLALATSVPGEAVGSERALVERYARRAWWSLRGWSCGTLVRSVGGFDPVATTLGKAWDPVRACARQVRQRFLCGLAERVLSDERMLRASVASAWRHRRTCLRSALRNGPLGLAPGLVCGLGRWAIGRVERLGTCLKQMQRDRRLRLLLDELRRSGCATLSRFAVAAAMKVVRGRGTVAAAVGGWVKRLHATQSAYDWHQLRRHLGARSLARAVATAERLVRRHPACLPLPEAGPVFGARLR